MLPPALCGIKKERKSRPFHVLIRLSGDDAQHRIDMGNAFKRIDARDRGAHGEFARFMRDDDERHLAVLTRGLLHKFHNGDVVFAEYRRDPGKDTRPVLHSQAHIIGALEIADEFGILIRSGRILESGILILGIASSVYDGISAFSFGM